MLNLHVHVQHVLVPPYTMLYQSCTNVSTCNPVTFTNAYQSQEETENLGHIPGVDPCFLTPDAFTSLPRGAIIGGGKRTTKTDFKIDSIAKELLGDAAAKSSQMGGGESEKHDQLLVQDIEARGGEDIRGIVPLKPPSEMFLGPQLHPLHIFVSMPVLSQCASVDAGDFKYLGTSCSYFNNSTD